MSNDAGLSAGRSTCLPLLSCVDCPLRKRDVFQPVGDAELAIIDSLKRADLEQAAGTPLIHENSDDSPLFTLLDGWAIRFKTLDGGRRQILNVMLPGDFIGLQQKMSDAANHGVRAITTVRLCSFARDALWTLHREMPSLGYDLTWLAAHSEAHVDENLLSVGRRSALERAAYLIAFIHERAVRIGVPDGKRLFIPITQQHVADTLGLSIVHTNKTLRRLAELDFIRWHERACEVIDAEGLRGIAEWDGLGEGTRPLI